ncbi:DUF445 domain-containing protein [Ketobacter alkanivorans]|uniref:DUF445 domain-containing protein n=1 Tax=Ketobacter alkanivorans TaxID=1917421 RepID=A0A2K9LPL5_9GAMM|nr:hypothetical protein [Ketobacter alkanivorans]AUM14233.1 hypothetical protein Kalk_18180 [Ketobacter alkanivorans]
MLEFYNEFVNHPDFWKYISIPFVAAIVGWTTNWLAIQLTFYPIKFIGIPPWLGWQGIIPKKGKKMAGIVVENTLDKISTMQEIFDEFEPEKIAHHIIKVADARIEELTDDIMAERNAVLWENLPNVLKNRAYNRARRQLPEMMDNLIEDMHANIEDLIDPKDLIIKKLSEDKDMLNRVFWECGETEFKFVINSGAFFGFLFGVVQMFVWWHNKDWLILPAFGLLVGLATNWLALNLIFRPLNPTKLTPFGPTVQGLFLSRQNAVSEVFCRIITAEILTIGHIMNEIFRGPKADRAKAMLKKHMRPVIDGGMVKTVAQLTVGPEGFVDLKRTIEEKTIEMSLASFDDPIFSKERGKVVEMMFRTRMQAMSSEEFQELLRPAFQEDEWILITMGGVLGLLAGFAQLFFMFAGV